MILGMHRSGTSALAGLVANGGVEPPCDLIPPASDNPLGFWEGRGVADLNDEMLAAVAARWDQPISAERCSPLEAPSGPWIERAKTVLRASFPAGRPILLKDPRLSFLVGVWSTAAKAEGYDPIAVIAVRSGDEIAGSLAKRNAMPSATAQLLCIAYLCAAEWNTRDMPRRFVQFTDVLRRPIDTVEDILRDVAGAGDIGLERQDIRRRVDPNLRHHRSHRSPFTIASTEVARLDRASRSAARTGVVDQKAFDRSSQWLRTINALLDPMLLAEQEQRRFLESQIRQHKAFEAHVDCGVVELRGEIARLTDLILAQQDEIIRLTPL